MKTIVASSDDDSYAVSWTERTMKMYAKDNLFYSYLKSDNFQYLVDLVYRADEEYHPPLSYFDFMNDPTIASAKVLVADITKDRTTKPSRRIVQYEKMIPIEVAGGAILNRSEERRVGKEC